MIQLETLRTVIRKAHLAPEGETLDRLVARHGPNAALRAKASERGAALVEAVRSSAKPGLMEVFLAEYGLSTQEGVALMCLAEALLRVPDTETIDALIEDKIAPSAWGRHLGRSASSLVNASTWALLLTGKVLSEGEGLASVLRGAIRRLGEPVIRVAVGRAMKELGAQFVLGRTIPEALERGRKAAAKGYVYSYDMLGEAAMTARDAEHFREAYSGAIASLAAECRGREVAANPGISIKLSALHPRYEEAQADRVMAELVPVVRDLALAAARAGMGLNIDAEEADRLDLSLDVIAAVAADPGLAGWDGFGVVVQAYGKRAPMVIDWLHALAERLDRRFMVRLVKGAYWDSEIKKAQVEGLEDFPVYTRKAATDVSYICCAAKLLAMRDRIYPQFATHNAHTVAAVLELAGGTGGWEFQRLHGMGESLHEIVRAAESSRCRIYAPVGPHRDLLAYLVRRLLENGANSSFVNQIVDSTIPAEKVAADPFLALKGASGAGVLMPAALFPGRRNSTGFDLRNRDVLDAIEKARAPWARAQWGDGEGVPILNPADPDDIVGHVPDSSPEAVEAALASARGWTAPAEERAEVLNRAADLYESEAGQIFALLAREAGKCLPDAVAELREAVDFLRYYAAGIATLEGEPAGVFTCISPWNFPLAIFTGQIAAGLAAGNAVLAKPAETTPLIARLAVSLLHRAGVPETALHLLPGPGPQVGAALTGDPRVSGVCFTGSTATAQRINRSMAAHMAPQAALIAETGGLNAMIVDSTALPEQAVRDIVASAFRSAGQRCSALRMLYLQEDVAPRMLDMLYGAMDELRLGNPWALETDVGPVISAEALAGIAAHVEAAREAGRLLKQLPVPEKGHFIGPAVISLPGIEALEREIFGPVLHVATYRAEALEKVIDSINARGYGLTFGIHSRIDDRVEAAVAGVRAGNIYVNRNQIGAVVGSQPFGGEGLSGTGPKAGGPSYLPRFTAPKLAPVPAPQSDGAADPAQVQKALDALAGQGGRHVDSREMPGPTGESNRLSEWGRGVVLCLGPTAEAAAEQARIATENGAAALVVCPGAVDGVAGRLDRAALGSLTGFDAVALWSDADDQRAARQALAARDGALIPLLTGPDMGPRCRVERHVSIDTTAAGGNAELLASSS
ncbi:bifunctional proline dehydrogenase/L-glutamate gamma-semialdehyde dehydrogenase PutA [Frigidibacter sp. ROC022]|uniref:bifunctional proline dehydrogenase/L-glutamate gamma-semialdehyde dehydrogenase PutA n=1 Tax=Frigidibacter sp. ROC022 TaxID=2971796 RepID=UPI00215AC252|nr:bifunctional proline dehydrogenase/L-glutamate gamma-semialdehyde dehydrogenase PutA [Frigidibacter sp. ROC022]MCR8723022.1 bifunctional proline dehydrogenase/L-glutamate gamma-semialdehyde dehydrogenase PutA [Frigidibacter sp. ROC022]